MPIEVRVDAEAPEGELRSLQDWLRHEPAVARAADISLLERPPLAGEMGGWVEGLQLVTDNAWNAASFVLAVAAWRRTRPRAPRLTFRRGDVELVMSEYTEAELQRVIAVLDARDGEPDERS